MKRKKVIQNKNERIKDLRTLWNLYLEDPDAQDEELGNIFEYGLCFDYVPAGTFRDQKRGYFCYQLSWGGPSDEFRFYCGPDLKVDKITYAYLDWFDGMEITLRGKDFELLKEIFEMFFVDSGTAKAALEKAMEYIA